MTFVKDTPRPGAARQLSGGAVVVPLPMFHQAIVGYDMNVPRLFKKLDREVELGVAQFYATVSAQVTDSEACACCNRLCPGHKCLPYAGKYNAQDRLPRRNIS